MRYLKQRPELACLTWGSTGDLIAIFQAVVFVVRLGGLSTLHFCQRPHSYLPAGLQVRLSVNFLISHGREGLFIYSYSVFLCVVTRKHVVYLCVKKRGEGRERLYL